MKPTGHFYGPAIDGKSSRNAVRSHPAMDVEVAFAFADEDQIKAVPRQEIALDFENLAWEVGMGDPRKISVPHIDFCKALIR